MDNVINGSDVIIELQVEADFIEILCADNCTYECNPEFIEKTGPSSGPARQWMRRIEEHLSTVSGYTPINNGAVASFFYMLQLGIRRDEQTIKMTFRDDQGNTFVIQGACLIGRQSISGPVSEFCPAAIEIRWNEMPTMTAIDPPTPKIVQDPLYLLLGNGDTYVQDPLLQAVGVEILCVERSGLGHDETNGTPGNRQFKFTGGAGQGKVAFDPANPGNAPGESIYILYQK